ncbi:hypothetical protein NMY3_02719 [Candidatus Nitrosocosmicus oleophilus]|jgi:hypothetical protein|uniref:Uncharacterized protein n=1 Tax=Candidatus Nitrosocosmicus oleophilus TaxID=1353260 RepID=A0A654M3A7_9ARCH|nr:hypothetical protein [Candidatus Nitrosocosmicus oleophilus]ALI36909.1 hypothetical protein NMY3_02719 [Candidatus Nitrosocosmicus oleophilus]
MQREYPIKMNIDDEIDKVIDSYVASTRENQDSDDPSRENLDEFTEGFSKKVHTVIFPVFKEIKNKLILHDIRCDIIDKIQGRFVTEMKLDIYPYKDISSAQDRHPSLTFFIEEPNKVTLYMQKMMQEEGTAGREGTFTLDEITTELVKEKILDLLKFCFVKK